MTLTRQSITRTSSTAPLMAFAPGVSPGANMAFSGSGSEGLPNPELTEQQEKNRQNVMIAGGALLLLAAGFYFLKKG